MIINEQGIHLDQNKISNHIYLKTINGFAGENYIVQQDVYMSLIAIQQNSFLSIDEKDHFKIQERNSLLLFIKKNTSISIKSNKLDSKNILILFNKTFIDQLLNTEDESLNQLLKYKHLRPIKDTSIYATSLEINHKQVPEYLKNLHQKSKTLEIFYKQLSAIAQMNETISSNIREDDIVKVNEVKRLIDQDVSQSYTISELAKFVGTNEQYLKQHFKKLYCTTIHNYMLKNKMNHAKQLLINGDEKIADVANKIGYKHATHFTTAFKKYFGYSPNTLRLQLIAYFSSYQLEFLSLEWLLIA